MAVRQNAHHLRGLLGGTTGPDDGCCKGTSLQNTPDCQVNCIANCMCFYV